MVTKREPRERRKPLRRDDSIRIRMSGEVLDRLDKLSALYGVPRATLAAMAIGQYVTNAERTGALVDRVAGSMGAEFKDALDSMLKDQVNMPFGSGKGRE